MVAGVWSEVMRLFCAVNCSRFARSLLQTFTVITLANSVSNLSFGHRYELCQQIHFYDIGDDGDGRDDEVTGKESDGGARDGGGGSGMGGGSVLKFIQ